MRIDRRSINLSSSQRLCRLDFLAVSDGLSQIERWIVLAAKPQDSPSYPSQFVRKRHCRCVAMDPLFELCQPFAQARMPFPVNIEPH